MKEIHVKQYNEQSNKIWGCVRINDRRISICETVKRIIEINDQITELYK